MRSWTFDQFEFEDPSSEERLQVAYALRSNFQFPSLAKFVEAVVSQHVARSLAEPSSFNDLLGGGTLRNNLRKFTGLEVPAQCKWPTYILSDEWNECCIILMSPDGFIYYFWSTSA